MAYSRSKSVTVSVKGSDAVRDVVLRFYQHTGVEQEHRVIFCGQVLENDKSISDYGIAPGDLHLLSLGPKIGLEIGIQEKWHYDSPPLPFHCLVAVNAMAVTTSDGKVDTFRVISDQKPKYPDLLFKTIRLSCESHPYSSSEKKYAGFVLYGWRDENDHVLDDWRLNGKHCKSAYFVIQGTDSPSVKQYIGRAPGQVHGAVYWSVFGKDSKVNMAVGEGFAYINGECKWNSLTFNANIDTYHDGKRGISDLAKTCVGAIIRDWKQTSQIGKTYSVKELLN